MNRYVLKNGAATAVVYYWYQGRGRVVANEYAVKWNLLRDAAVAGHTEEALVRVVVPVAYDRADVSPAQRREAALARANDLGGTIAARSAADVSKALPNS